MTWAFRKFLDFIRQKGGSPALTEEERIYLRMLIWNMTPSEVALLDRVLVDILIEKFGDKSK